MWFEFIALYISLEKNYWPSHFIDAFTLISTFVILIKITATKL